MRDTNELMAWIYNGKPAFADPIAELFERSVPLSALILASICGIVAIIARNSRVNSYVQALMGGLALIGIGFFMVRMVGYYAASSTTEFSDLALGISFSWQSTAFFFAGISIALISVLIAQVVEKRALARIK